MQTSIKSVRLVGLHGHQEVFIELKPGLNILYGVNGSGKTTLLHVLANLADLDLQRFHKLLFKMIEVHTTSDNVIRLESKCEFDKKYIQLLINGEGPYAIKDNEPLNEEIEGILAKIFSGQPLYLPAFRSILDAASERQHYEYQSENTFSEENRNQYQSIRDKEFDRLKRKYPNFEGSMMRLRDKADSIAYKTIFCRRWFGEFVPVIRYPSLRDVSRELFVELEQAYFALSLIDQRTLSTVFEKVLNAVLGESPSFSVESKIQDLLKHVQESLKALHPTKQTDKNLYSRISTFLQHAETTKVDEPIIKYVLNIYDDALSHRANNEKKLFNEIRMFESSVNQFLGGSKRIEIGFGSRGPRRSNALMVKLPNEKTAGPYILSSGERHIITMIFSSTHMSQYDGIVLIDEPELSLHVDWQRLILGELTKQADGRQIIACTHSPEVAAEHRDSLIHLNTINWQEISTNAYGHVELESVDNE